MGTSQASPGGRRLWTEPLTPSVLLTPLASPQLPEDFRGGDGEGQTAGSTCWARTWCRVRGQHSGGAEKHPVKTDRHIALSHAHPHADTQAPGALWWKDRQSGPPGAQPGKDTWPMSCTLPAPEESCSTVACSLRGHLQGGSRTLLRAYSAPLRAGLHAPYCRSSDPAGQATGCLRQTP